MKPRLGPLRPLPRGGTQGDPSAVQGPPEVAQGECEPPSASELLPPQSLQLPHSLHRLLSSLSAEVEIKPHLA